MTLSRRTVTIGAAAAFLALAAGHAVSSAPSPAIGLVLGQETVSNEAWRPGADGVDVAAITGPKGSAGGAVPACADPARRGDLRPC